MGRRKPEPEPKPTTWLDVVGMVVVGMVVVVPLSFALWALMRRTPFLRFPGPRK